MADNQKTPEGNPLAENGWNEHKLLVLKELQSIQDKLDRIDRKYDEKHDEHGKEIAGLKVEMAIQKTKAGMLGFLGGSGGGGLLYGLFQLFNKSGG